MASQIGRSIPAGEFMAGHSPDSLRIRRDPDAMIADALAWPGLPESHERREAFMSATCYRLTGCRSAGRRDKMDRQPLLSLSCDRGRASYRLPSMETGIVLLCGTAALLGFIHTALGPDHYIPFVAMSRARRWSVTKTIWVTFLCGLGHVLSSVALGLLGLLLGIEVFKLEALEGFRGTLAAWLLIGFGFAYFVWGIQQAIRNRPHRHVHSHGDLIVHDHLHSHETEHMHVHDSPGRDITPWVLFTLFILGPCEPLIPLLMYPAANGGIGSMSLVAAVFGVTTIGTMLVIVALSTWGVAFARLGRLERYTHVMAGAMIFLAGLSVQFLGL